MKKTISSLMLCFSQIALAQTELEFRSAYDRFTLHKQGSKYTLDGRTVDLGPTSEFLSLFTQKFFDECTGLTGDKPDLTLRLKNKDQSGVGQDSVTTRTFYIAKRVISDGKNCVLAGGSGINYLPLHRSWYDANKKMNFPFGTHLQIKKGEKIFGTFKKDESDWVDAKGDLFIDWDFFERFVKSLNEFNIDLRLHPSAGEGKTNFQLVADGKTFEFYKVDHNLWAMKPPDKGWLMASKEWAFWQDMDDSMWKDRFEERIRIVSDKNKSVEERKSTLMGLSAYWSASIKRALHKILLDDVEEQEMKDLALQLLKRKPSLDNFKVLVQTLQKPQTPKFQSEITKALRVRNPKGPVIDPKSDDSVREKAIAEWTKWWKTTAKTP